MFEMMRTIAHTPKATRAHPPPFTIVTSVTLTGQFRYTLLMPNIDKHAPGDFCWIELATTDQNAAKSFYGTLFGWAVNDSPMGPNDFYSMFQIDGRQAA